jgi:hypothetical protein
MDRLMMLGAHHALCAEHWHASHQIDVAQEVRGTVQHTCEAAAAQQHTLSHKTGIE